MRIIKTNMFGRQVHAFAQNKREEQVLFLIKEWPSFVKKHGKNTKLFEAYAQGKRVRQAVVDLRDLKEACSLTSTPINY